jgi:hypothetical protein
MNWIEGNRCRAQWRAFMNAREGVEFIDLISDYQIPKEDSASGVTS